jgi:outer membrane lipoprotein-sorting protein
MKNIVSAIILPLFLLLFIPTAEAQSAQDIIDQMLEEYTSSISDVETMMMVTRMEGFLQSEEPDTTYYRKVMRDGLPVLETVGTGTEIPTSGYYNIQDNYDALVENSEYEGTETVNGREAHVIFIRDVSALYDEVVTSGVEDETQQAQPQTGRMYIDAEDYIPVRMNFDIDYDGEYTGSADIQMMDIREVDGMKVPFEMVMKFSGISDTMSAEEMAETRQQLEEFEQQLEDASGMQRRIMERVVKPQIERLSKILEEGGLTMRTYVLDVQTNIDIPE